ncbi:MAG: c-type cytochrome domain-containing protein, partial [Planctomycetota bacterium]
MPTIFVQEIKAQKISADQLTFFESKIRPVLVRECYSCHSGQAGQIKGGLRVDTKIRLEIGGENGPAIVPGELEESLLWNAINHEDFVMPPRKKLSERDIANFKTWIEMGAPDPRKSKVAKIQSTVSDDDIRKGRKFWSFVAPKVPALPEIKDPGWFKNEVDLFVAEKLEEEGLTPADDADPYQF